MVPFAATNSERSSERLHRADFHVAQQIRKQPCCYRDHKSYCCDLDRRFDLLFPSHDGLLLYRGSRRRTVNTRNAVGPQLPIEDGARRALLPLTMVVSWGTVRYSLYCGSL